MINVSQPVIGKDEIQYVSDAVASGWVSSQGEFIQKFEKSFAKFCGTEHCVLVANGTVALHLALEVLGIGEGDEVILPDLTFVATANIVKMAGGTPVLADVKMDSWCIDPEDVKRKITSKTKAIIPVHIYGHPAEMDQLQQIADEKNIVLIEDAAEAHGATYKGKKVGSMSTMATFSFFGNKIITTGEGGAITTNSAELADRARFLRDHGMSRTKRYWYTEVGYNYRMTNMQAALGLAQMNSIDSFIEQRAEILETYKQFLSGVDFIKFNAKTENAQPVNWITCLLIEDFGSTQRDLLIEKLKESGIDSRPFFYTVSSLPMYSQTPCPNSIKLSQSGINLPTYPGLSKEQIKFICEKLSQHIAEIRTLNN
jgi:perosamine synthetase